MQTSPQNSISRSTRNRNINHAVKQKCLLKWSTSETVESTLETLPACHATWPGVHTERTATEGALWWLGQKSARIHLGQWIYRFFLLKKSMAFYTCEVSHYQAWRGDVVPITMGPPYPRARHPNINIHRCRVPSLGGCLRGPLKDFRTCSKYHPPQILWTMEFGISGGWGGPGMDLPWI